MMDSHGKHPIIVRKVVKKGGGHHGGAWKVAYADFVTAMMALFIVLWLMNTEDSTKQAIAGYFKDPTGANKDVGSGAAGSGEGLVLRREDMGKLKEKIESALQKVPDFKKKLEGQVHMTVTGEGLRIELLESEKGVFFENGNAEPTASARTLLAVVAQELGKLANAVAIEGHTDATPFTGKGTYGNWELSADRANTARRLMTTLGLDPGQISQVRGFADRNLRVQNSPGDPSNRRVSVVVQYLSGQIAAARPQMPEATPPPSAH